MIASKKSLHKLVLISLVSVSLICTIALGAFLISLEIHTLNSQSEQLAQSTYERSLQHTSERVKQLATLVNDKRLGANAELRNTLKRRVREATAQAKELLAHENNLPPIIQRDLIINTLRPVRFNEGRSYITIMDLNGKVLLSPDYPGVEGKHYSRHLSEMDGLPFLTMISKATSSNEGFVKHPPFKEDGKESFLWYYRLLPELGWIIISHESITFHENRTQNALLQDIEAFIQLDPSNFEISTWRNQTLLSKGSIAQDDQSTIQQNIVGWDWTIKATPMMAKIEQSVIAQQTELRDRITSRIGALAIAVIVMLVIASLISYLFSRRIKHQLQHFLSNMRRFALENKPIDTDQLDISEFRLIAQTANRFASQREIMLNELQRLSQRDPLTDLYNRRHMSEILILEEARIKRNQGCFGLILADIDHFKNINDQYGHEAGDLAIKQVAYLLKETLRKQDQISRWGGEEFLILLPDASPVAALKVAEKLCKSIRNLTIDYKGASINPTLTCGVTYHDGNLDLMESIDRADKALYEGKKSGRDCVVPKAPFDIAFAAGA